MVANRLDPERYLLNKEYFDSSLIECLSRMDKKCKDQKAVIEKDSRLKKEYRLEINVLKAQVKNRESTISRLKSGNTNTENINNDLRKQLDEACKIISKLQTEVNELKTENMSLKEELRNYKETVRQRSKDNTNSNIPSSFMMFKANANSRKSTSRKRGGQKGHELHKSLLGKPDKIIIKHVKKAPTGAILNCDENGKSYFTVQEIDLRFKTKIIETRYYLDGEKELSAKEREKYKINPVTYSDNTRKSVLFLYSKGVIAFERLAKMINALSNDRIYLKPSTVAKWIKKYSDDHKTEREALLKELLKQPILIVDETGFRVNGKGKWIYTLTDGKRKYYLMTAGRSDFIEYLKDYKGILVHDHYKPYYQINCTHSECNAHILRYLKAAVDLDDHIPSAEMIHLLQTSLHKKHTLQKEGINEFPKDELARIEEEYLNIVNTELVSYFENNRDIPKKYIPEYIKTFQRMKEYKDEHLRFLYDFDVPFSSNDAERSLRMIKARKKISGQCDSIETGNAMLSLLLD